MSNTSTHDPINVMYFGTPEFAVPTLRTLAAAPDLIVSLVVTQPDRPAGRGRRVTPSPVKQAALELELPIYQPERLRTEDQREPLVNASADFVVVAAYGLIFGPKTLAIPRRGCLNLHASLLPNYRGASPISAAIAMRDQFTGVTLMHMDTGLDTGAILTAESLAIHPDDTTESLTDRLANLAANMAPRGIRGILDGTLTLRSQRRGATLTRPLVKDDGWIDWSRSAIDLDAHVRAMWPWPRAHTSLSATDGSHVTLQVHTAHASAQRDTTSLAPGTLIHHHRELLVATGDGWLALDRVQLPGGRPLSASDVIAGGRLPPETRLGQIGAPQTQPPLVIPVEETL